MQYFLQKLEYRNPDQFGGNVLCDYDHRGHDHDYVLRDHVRGRRDHDRGHGHDRVRGHVHACHGHVLHGLRDHDLRDHVHVLHGLQHDHVLHGIRVVLGKEFPPLHKIQDRNLENQVIQSEKIQD